MKPIRVLHVVDRLNRGGAETMIMNIYRNIDKEKIQFDFLVHTNEKSDYDEEVLALGGRIFSIERFSIRNLYKYRKSIDKFLNINNDYKIIHCHMASVASIIFNRAKKLNIPIRIIHSHNAAVDSMAREIMKNIMRKSIINNSNVYFSCSDKSSKWLLGKNFDLSKVNIIKNGIDLDEFKFDSFKREEIRKKLGLEEKFVIGHVGRFTKMKNHKFVIEIFNIFQKKNDNAVLLLVGRGELEEEIKQMVTELNLQNKVIFLGVRNDINKIMNAMDIFLFPSIQEALGIVLLEAQATGLKCITSKNSVSRDISVTDLVEFVSLNDSAEIWCEQICKINENYIRKSRSKELEYSGYSILKSSKYIESMYLDLLNKKPKHMNI